jgi:hypothetical protein
VDENLQVTSFAVTPTTLDEDNSITIKYAITGNKALSYFEFYHDPNEEGSSGFWTQIDEQDVSDTIDSGSFQRTSDASISRHGLHVHDVAGNSECEGTYVNGPDQVASNVARPVCEENGSCESEAGETCSNCEADCGECAMNKTGRLFAPYLEWTLNNPSYSGNPFDLVASATFVHQGSGKTHKTEMFYDGGTTWKFRFTGTLTGTWRFTTASSDLNLNGHNGIVTINSNPDSNIRGFLKSVGNRFAIEVGENELQGYRLNVYQNATDFPDFEWLDHLPPPDIVGALEDSAVVDAYLQDARDNGFETVYMPIFNNWFHAGANKHTQHSSVNPDTRTFRALERFIVTAHSRGFRVHIWPWGDEQHKLTQIGAGGINGIPDKRLQRYIAARLGPLPGWTMGYGWDLFEWVNGEQLGEWASYLHEHFGWQHLLWGRGRYHSELDAKSYAWVGTDLVTDQSSGSLKENKIIIPVTYEEVIEKLNTDLARPHFEEERFWYRMLENNKTTPDKYNFSMENIRRYLWIYTMAGGLGSWWGFYYPTPGHHKKGDGAGYSPPFTHPEQLRTVSKFWNNRFLLDMEPANNLTDGYALKTPANAHYVFYKQDTSSIQMNLSKMSGSQPAIAVDAKLEYVEINLGPLTAKNQTWTAPRVSDWAIAVGHFSTERAGTAIYPENQQRLR